jgi:hypothetical protein
MHIDAGDLDAGQAGCFRIDLARAPQRDAELVLGFSRRDLAVGPRIDVRIEIGALRPRETATSESASSSGSDSTLKQRMPASRAAAISSRVFPTPENTIREPGMPAANARRSSPSETMSMPAPRRPSVRRTAWFEFAFMA